MKKIVIVYGLISGLICSMWWWFFAGNLSLEELMSVGMILGFGSMLVSFALLFVAIIKYRNNYNNGVLTFLEGLKVGLLISIITATIYVVSWNFYFNMKAPDFFEKYAAASIKQMENDGKSTPKEIEDAKVEMQEKGEKYKNSTVYRMGVTYMEILPMGVVVSLIAALVLRRKEKKLTA